MNNRQRNLNRYLLWTFFCVAVIPVVVLGIIFCKVTYDAIFSNTGSVSMSTLEKTVQNLDTLTEMTTERSAALSLDVELYNALNSGQNGGKRTASDYFIDNRAVGRALSRYFPISSNVYSSFIVSEKFTYTNGSQLNPTYDDIKRMGILDLAIEADGQMVWFSTYDYIKALNMPMLLDIDIDYRYLVTAARVLNVRSIPGGNIPLKTEHPPVLIINFKPEQFSKYFTNDNMPYSKTLIATPQGSVVASTDDELLTMVDDILTRPDGFTKYSQNGETFLLCKKAMRTTGWIVAQLLPSKEVLRDVLFLPQLVGALTFVLGIIAIIIAMRFSKLNERISNINSRAYKSEIREKEAEILALNLQIKPHFLYNTLGIFNYMAIENGDTALSKMIISLSNMLRYTTKRSIDLALFSDDIDWLSGYLTIMQTRFAERFTVVMDFDQQAKEARVPKLFLQPFVENAIIHGFSDIENGGKLTISGHRLQDEIVFVVSDNGKGMPQTQADAILAGESEGVGIYNTARRISLVFGDKGHVSISTGEGKGVTAIIKLPVAANS